MQVKSLQVCEQAEHLCFQVMKKSPWTYILQILSQASFNHFSWETFDAHCLYYTREMCCAILAFDLKKLQSQLYVVCQCCVKLVSVKSDVHRRQAQWTPLAVNDWLPREASVVKETSALTLKLFWTHPVCMENPVKNRHLCFRSVNLFLTAWGLAAWKD